ncbi:hypothetical protein [Levilactobacillus yiduensis]|uniref:hypothetical protein n=1 Tax=Levilactobacillus yiduensis TaxID=2953880 RepID=UPI000EF2C66A|nr:hypothetical protein [Levilactobacillus yiduensis]AYM03677.1 hypothetical protein D8911_12040 [Levilactobacillus brevis]
MEKQQLDTSVLTAALETLRQGQSQVSKGQETNSAAIAMCELVQPTLVSKSQGKDYFKYSDSELRSMLDDRDLIIYQAAQVIAVLADKAMDLDSLLGHTENAFKKSVDYLTSKDESEAATHE